MINRIKKLFPFSFKNLGITIAILAIASALCFFLRPVSENDFHVPLFFLLAVLFISLFTEGYLFGMASAVVAVFFVNYVFAYPYMEMDFSLTGYPLTFISMFVASIIVCTLSVGFKERRDMRARAERESMRADLMRTVSHDFRTPLTSIIGTIDLIQRDGSKLSKFEKDRLLTDARSDAEWLINMVENLISVTRVGDDPKKNIHREVYAAEEIVAEAVERFKKQYADFKVTAYPPDEILFVNADAILIEQVIMNILVNSAIHARGASGAEIHVEKENASAKFIISDDGAGFSEERLKNIFSEYSGRSDDKDEGRLRGMGIGLSVCKAVIKAHDGIMDAYNIAAGGACVIFTLPISEVENGD